MATLAIIFFLTILGFMTFMLPWFLNTLADRNILYTKVKEGTAKAIMGGRSFKHLVMSLKGYHLNHEGDRWYDPEIPEWEVVKNPKGENCDSRSFLTRWLGIYFVGIPPFRKIYSYLFEWKEMGLNKETRKQDVIGRSEQTEFVFTVPFPYIIDLDAAETCDNIPVDVQYQLTVRVTNPFKALFDTENWMEAITGVTNAAARNFIGSKKYDQLVSETHESDGSKSSDEDRFSKTLIALNQRLADGSEGTVIRYGVTVVGADVQTIAVAGEHKDTIVLASVKRFTATNDADAIRIRADANAYATVTERTAEAEGIVKIGEAQAKSITARLDAWNSGGKLNALIAQLDAMSSAGPNKTVIWANNPFVTQIDGLAQMLDSLGVKTVDEFKSMVAGKTSAKPQEGGEA